MFDGFTMFLPCFTIPAMKKLGILVDGKHDIVLSSKRWPLFGPKEDHLEAQLGLAEEEGVP